jgi:gluconate 2-dehydrogenase gamma chain
LGGAHGHLKMLHRRELLAGVAWLALSGAAAHAGLISGRLPWEPNAGHPPDPVRPGRWIYFTGQEGAAVEALADRIIPPDPGTPGGKDSGCAVYLDRQLAGPYGRDEGLYMRAPFMKGIKQQGPQSQSVIAKTYRSGLAALDKYCQSNHAGKRFAELTDNDKDEVLKGLESEKIKLEGADGKKFFTQVIKDVQAGFFADPIYGGNRDMVSWKMIGFPGARYNYLDWIDRHNERFPLPPVSLAGRIDWTPKR